MSGSSRTIKLFCPSLSKLVSFSVLEEQRLDLGSIARTFGLDPVTLRLNGYFISRGVDLISSSVTWKSLLSFFAARGLSTGNGDNDALIVNGKLCKPGTKREHNPSDSENEDHQTTEYNGLSIKRKPQMEDVKIKKKMVNECNSGAHKPSDSENGDHQITKYNALGLKRKPWPEDVNTHKKKRMKESNSGSQPNTISSIQFKCSNISGSLKRLREDEIIMSSTPCKRTR